VAVEVDESYRPHLGHGEGADVTLLLLQPLNGSWRLEGQLRGRRRFQRRSRSRVLPLDLGNRGSEIELALQLLQARRVICKAAVALHVAERVELALGHHLRAG